ncbi:Integrase domain containing protein-like protein, partial [Leptotrombidium deliense]
LPLEIVTDNRTSFTSKQFEDFCRNNGIKHIRSQPYHPSTNGAAERNTPHNATGISPAEMFIGRTDETKPIGLIASYRNKG